MKRWIAAALVAALNLTCVTAAHAQYIINGTPMQNLQALTGWNNAILSAGIMATANMAKADVLALQGKVTPEASYVVQPAVQAKIDDDFAQQFAGAGATSGQIAQALSYVHEKDAAYVADSRSQGVAPNNFVTACAYFAAASFEIELDRKIDSAERRALRGSCVMDLAGYQAGFNVLTNEKDRQTIADQLTTLAGVSLDEWKNAKPADKPGIKSGVEATFKKMFHYDLGSIDLDHLACTGAKTERDREQCASFPNSRFAAIADNTR